MSIFHWVAFGIFLDFTVAVTVHFHPPYIRWGGEASLSRLLIVAKALPDF